MAEQNAGGAKLAEVIESRGITQAAVEKALKKSSGYVSRLISGEYTPGRGPSRILANSFGVAQRLWDEPAAPKGRVSP